MNIDEAKQLKIGDRIVNELGRKAIVIGIDLRAEGYATGYPWFILWEDTNSSGRVSHVGMRQFARSGDNAQPTPREKEAINRWQQEKINAQQVEQFVEAAPAISPPPYGAIEEIVEYLLHDEEEDWKAKGKPAKHIYHSVRTVADWLAAQA